MAELRESFCVDAVDPCFEGHFPGQPIVPAVVLLERIAGLARAALGCGALSGVPQAKFLRPVGPGEAVDCVLQATGDASLRFCATVAGAIVAQGSLQFAPAP